MKRGVQTHSPFNKNMKKEIAKIWVAALRSGKYKQGTSYLRKGDEFCCLGVLCDLAIKADVIDEAIPHPSGRQGIFCFDDGSTEMLPKTVQEWSGLNSDDGAIAAVHHDLASFNDDGKPFSEIADIIEANVEAL